ncbi:MAG: putative ABC transporter permease [Lachnospiraceae bacterium]
MNFFLILAFLFFAGSLIGWGLEVIYRRFFSDCNPEKKWINPGFLVGPYLPLYGFSLVSLFLLSYIPVDFIHNRIWQKIILFIIMAVVVTIIEYVAGLIFIKGMNIKLWDYSNEWLNIKGIICPKYSCFWMILSAIYYFLIHPYILNALTWLAGHLAFSFVIGFFYGVFVIDLCYSMQIATKIRKFAKDNQIEVRIEELKRNIRKINDEYKIKASFIFAIKSEERQLIDSLKDYMKREQEKYSVLKDTIDNVKKEYVKNKSTKVEHGDKTENQ